MAEVPTISADALSFWDIGQLFVAKIMSYVPDSSTVHWLWDGYTKTLYEEGYSTYHIVLELFLFVVLLKLLLTPRQRSESDADKLTEKEIDELVADWQPEPLVQANIDPDDPVYLKRPTLVGRSTARSKYDDGQERIQLATFNFLGNIGDPDVEQKAIEAIRTYGVGSCGPRGFYGSIDVHIELEERLAQFLGTEEAIIYSYGFATIASAIPAYAKRGDVIFCDEGVSFATQKGLQASRSTLKFFKHNDMQDLERLLKEQELEDQRKPKKAAITRRFLVVEGLYENYGDICPLPKVIEFKHRYKVRVFLEESMSFGVLGATGRGVTEHFGIPITEIDQICASMENSLGSVGGFCAGSTFVIDHQRLSGQGYCFSASLPPLLAVAALEALNKMETDPRAFDELRRKSQLFRSELRKNIKHMVVCGDDISPIVHLRLNSNAGSIHEQNVELQKVIDGCWEKGVAVTRAKYISEKEMFMPQPSLRIIVTVKHTDEDLIESARIIAQASERLA